jgi:hypothetical protein
MIAYSDHAQSYFVTKSANGNAWQMIFLAWVRKRCYAVRSFRTPAALLLLQMHAALRSAVDVTAAHPHPIQL